MPLFRIRLINSDFESSEDTNFASLAAARNSAVATAMKIAADSIADGADNAAVEIEIYDSGRIALRQVVTLSVSELVARP